ncbi:MAG: Lrp/AsnC family transcriptional regulator [Thermoplasmata archaeon]
MIQNSLDKRDLKIITVLKNNARASIREISKATGIRPSTVHQRIKRLVGNEVIEKFTIKLNDDKIDEGFATFMLISGTTERYLDSKILENQHVKGIYGITGEYDLLIKMKFKDMNAFNEFLLEFREKYSTHISKTLTMVQTVKLKDE